MTIIVKFGHGTFANMTSTQESSAPNPEDCFKILLATDIHLGYKEKDEIIGKYSASTHFEYRNLLRIELLLESRNDALC